MIFKTNEYSKSVLILLIGVLLISCSQNKKEEIKSTENPTDLTEAIENKETMKLGAFSVSLNVKDLKASKAFYEKLGFTVFGGDMEMNYLIMKNGNSLIGLFQGMFENNILTFNPGWDENAKELESYDDVREIQKQLKNKGLTLESEADENTSGPASLVIKDPDGNVIFIDQHI